MFYTKAIDSRIYHPYIGRFVHKEPRRVLGQTDRMPGRSDVIRTKRRLLIHCTDLPALIYGQRMLCDLFEEKAFRKSEV